MFDALTGTATAFDVAEIEKSDKIEMCRKRREDAVALWKTIPDEQFDIGYWKSDCGTTCCAIGWLAEKQHDGWRMLRHPANAYSAGQAFPARDNNQYSSAVIREYFGLTQENAADIFGYWGRNHATARFYNKVENDIKLSDVSKALMEAPYNV